MLELPRLGAPFSSQAGIDVRAKTADGGVRRTYLGYIGIRELACYVPLR